MMGTNMEEPKMETNGLEEGTNGLAEEEADRGGVG
jgi:hypothetical protein